MAALANPTASQAPAQEMTAEQLLEQLKACVKDLLSDHVDDDAQYEKVYQYLRLRKADYYYRGIQYIAPQISVTTGNVDWAPSGAPSAGAYQGGLQPRGVLDYNIDIVRTLGKKFIATLG